MRPRWRLVNSVLTTIIGRPDGNSTDDSDDNQYSRTSCLKLAIGLFELQDQAFFLFFSGFFSYVRDNSIKEGSRILYYFGRGGKDWLDRRRIGQITSIWRTPRLSREAIGTNVEMDIRVYAGSCDHSDFPSLDWTAQEPTATSDERT